MKQQLIRTEKDFGGYWVKGVKEHRGHEGEPLVQCSVWKDGKKFALYSDGDWGGPATLEPFKPVHKGMVEDFQRYAKTKSDYKYEPESDVIMSIVHAYEVNQKVKRICKTKTVFVTPASPPDSYRSVTSPVDVKVRAWVAKKYPEHIIINDLV